MTTMKKAFAKATKKQAKLRAAIYALSGGGKTFTALRIATGLGGKIAVIDSECGSASKYADRFEFDVLELGHERTIEAYVEGIQAAAAEKYDVLILDSLSHAWQELLEEIDRIAKAKYKGNTWSAWSEGTPKQKKLIDAILGYPGHVIATMRAKTEWSTSDGGGGKSKPSKVGLAPEQGKGIEYEFDLLLSLTAEHVAFIEKDRTGRFQDKTIEKPGEDFGRELAAWLSDGATPATAPAAPEEQKAEGPALYADKEAAAFCVSYARGVAAAEDWDAFLALVDDKKPQVERCPPKWLAVARALEERVAAHHTGAEFVLEGDAAKGVEWVDAQLAKGAKQRRPAEQHDMAAQ